MTYKSGMLIVITHEIRVHHTDIVFGIDEWNWWHGRVLSPGTVSILLEKYVDPNRVSCPVWKIFFDGRNYSVAEKDFKKLDETFVSE